MKALQTTLFIYTLGVTCIFVVFMLYIGVLNTTVIRTKPLHFEAHIEPVKAVKVYPNYYDDNLHIEWPFNLTKNYTESHVCEWSEQKILRDENSYGFGEDGAGFVPTTDAMKELMEKLKKENNFNLLASEMISLHRSLPDSRYEECKHLSYPRKLPTTSVIIVFHNEAWTTLLRTVWSVIDRSPIELIKEIILVDDVSTWSFLKRPLDDYIETIPACIKIIRNTQREGLIRARLIGAQHATLKLWRQQQTYINGFHWSLIFNWEPIPSREVTRTHNDKTAPVRTPTMIGCAFSIDNEFFFEIGSYDEQMNIWGSENMEMSLRVWQCGGSMEIVPCSRVGHLYRISTYSFDGDADDIKAKNNKRLVEVWMPEMRNIFYAANPSIKRMSGGNLTERIALKQRLKCKNFHWYLEHVYPESSLKNEFIYFGDIKSESRKGCLDTVGGSLRGPLKIIPCHNLGGNQIFGLTKTQKIITFDKLCAGVYKNSVVLVNCFESPQWKYDNETKWLIHLGSKLCMHATKIRVKLGKCAMDDDTFKWNIRSVL